MRRGEPLSLGFLHTPQRIRGLPMSKELLDALTKELLLMGSSVGQVRDGLPKVHAPQQVEAGSQGPTALGNSGNEVQGILN